MTYGTWALSEHSQELGIAHKVYLGLMWEYATLSGGEMYVISGKGERVQVVHP